MYLQKNTKAVLINMGRTYLRLHPSESFKIIRKIGVAKCVRTVQALSHRRDGMRSSNEGGD
jgi:hypothetical protein